MEINLFDWVWPILDPRSWLKHVPLSVVQMGRERLTKEAIFYVCHPESISAKERNTRAIQAIYGNTCGILHTQVCIPQGCVAGHKMTLTMTLTTIDSWTPYSFPWPSLIAAFGSLSPSDS